MTKSTAPQHFAFLDALRGLAALAVVTVHTVQNFSTGIFDSILGQGANGVSLFYIVSAFSLCLSLEQRKSGETRHLRNYLIRRFFRIAPLFWFAIVVYLLRPFVLPMSAAPVDVHPPSWPLAAWHVVATGLFVNGWHYQSINFVVPGGWSVAVESNFYLLLPLLFLMARSLRRSVVVLFVTLALYLVTRKALYLLFSGHIPPEAALDFGTFSGLWLPSQLPVFALGIVMFWLVPRSSLSPNATGPKSRLLQPLLLVALSIGLLLIAPDSLRRMMPLMFPVALILLGFCWFVAWCPTRIVVNAATLYLGRISYSLYLFHFIALHLVVWASREFFLARYGSPLPFLVAFPIVLAIATGIARLTYGAIEVPGQSLGRLMIAKLAAREISTSLK
jgi:peptidoglycan/LPS O-acetylase OafA/YrhL